MTFSIMTFRIITFSIITFSITKLGIYYTQQNDIHHNEAEHLSSAK